MDDFSDSPGDKNKTDQVKIPLHALRSRSSHSTFEENQEENCVATSLADQEVVMESLPESDVPPDELKITRYGIRTEYRLPSNPCKSIRAALTLCDIKPLISGCGFLFIYCSIICFVCFFGWFYFSLFKDFGVPDTQPSHGSTSDRLSSKTASSEETLNISIFLGVFLSLLILYAITVCCMTALHRNHVLHERLPEACKVGCNVGLRASFIVGSYIILMPLVIGLLIPALVVKALVADTCLLAYKFLHNITQTCRTRTYNTVETITLTTLHRRVEPALPIVTSHHNPVQSAYTSTNMPGKSLQ